MTTARPLVTGRDNLFHERSCPLHDRSWQLHERSSLARGLMSKAKWLCHPHERSCQLHNRSFCWRDWQVTITHERQTVACRQKNRRKFWISSYQVLKVVSLTCGLVSSEIRWLRQLLCGFYLRLRLHLKLIHSRHVLPRSFGMSQTTVVFDTMKHRAASCLKVTPNLSSLPKHSSSKTHHENVFQEYLL